MGWAQFKWSWLTGFWKKKKKIRKIKHTAKRLSNKPNLLPRVCKAKSKQKVTRKALGLSCYISLSFSFTFLSLKTCDFCCTCNVLIATLKNTFIFKRYFSIWIWMLCFRSYSVCLYLFCFPKWERKKIIHERQMATIISDFPLSNGNPIWKINGHLETKARK